MHSIFIAFATATPLFKRNATEQYSRGLGTPINCLDGDISGGLCYSKCPTGFKGLGPICWEICPQGYTDDGPACKKGSDVKPKKSLGRGVGSPISTCRDGKQLSGALCYTPCKPGYTGVGPICWKA